MNFTTLSSWAVSIAAVLMENGCDSDELFLRAGLNLDKLGSANARYPVDRLQHLWSLAQEATANPGLGMEIVDHWHPATMHALGYACLASESLIAALERFVRYGHILSTDLRFDIRTTSTYVELSVLHDDRRSAPIDVEIDATMAVLFHVFRMTFGDPLYPLQVRMTRATPEDMGPYRHLFGRSVQFAASQNVIRLRKSDAVKRLLTANAALARTCDELAIEYLIRIEHDHLSLQVRRELVELLPIGDASQRSVAKRIGVSARGLQRRLAREGTSYQKILDETRSTLALEYLGNGFDVQRVAFMLGFSDSSAFAKAFRRWFSVSPLDYIRGSS